MYLSISRYGIIAYLTTSRSILSFLLPYHLEMTGLNSTRTPNGKVAIVTGSAQGIGAAIVSRLARDGFDVVVADLKSADAKAKAVAAECEATGAKVAIIPVDVRSEEDVTALVEQTAAKLGRVDGEFVWIASSFPPL